MCSLLGYVIDYLCETEKSHTIDCAVLITESGCLKMFVYFQDHAFK